MPLNILSLRRHSQKCYPLVFIQKVTMRNTVQSPKVFLDGQVDLRSWVKCSQELLLCRGTRKANPSHPLGTTLRDTATRQRQTTERNYSQISSVGKSCVSPAWSPRSSGLAASGLAVGNSIFVQQHIFKRRSGEIFYPSCATQQGHDRVGTMFGWFSCVPLPWLAGL